MNHSQKNAQSARVRQDCVHI